DDYTATAQLLGAAGTKLAQDDFPPGGDYYPSSLWKPGDLLVVEHTLALDAPLPANATLLLAFYRAADLAALADPVQIPIP
ncbi:MAG: hypothetical protein DCC57_07625, partial [Chloroflexi bacterium]